MADDLSSDSVAPRGVDLVAGRAGSYNRSTGIPAPTAATVAATGAAGGVEVSGHGTLRADLVISAAGSTITIAVQTSFDNGVTDPWRTVASFPAQTSTGTVRKVFAGLDRWVCFNVTAVTGSFTFTLSGELV